MKERSARWELLKQEDLSFTNQRSVLVMMEESLLRLPFRGKGHFLWLAGVCAVIWDMWGQRNNQGFRGREMDPCEFWSLVRFHLSFWASILKAFVTIPMVTFYFYLVGTHSLKWGVSVWLFLICPCILSYFSMNVTFLKRKRKKVSRDHLSNLLI